MPRNLPDGTPHQDDYVILQCSADFKGMESFSETFLERNRAALAGYSAKWVTNPLRQWSRQWEYPYVLGKVGEVAQGRPGRARILDAGSGATFLPYYIEHCFKGTTVACCDTDHTLADVFSSLNENMNAKVEFSTADVRALPYEDNSFDLVYCVSVLEHTDDYETILNELSRVSNGGRMSFTFDVSLDGTRDMRIENLDRLLRLLAVDFEKPDLHRKVHHSLSRPGIVTTRTVAPELLPWRGPALLHRIKSSFANRRLVQWPPLMTVCCLSSP